jgi:sugar phosphate isomerase/epimerase
MLFGYNTNGFANHRLEDALTILADLSYGSIAITLDHCALDPFDPDLLRQLDRVRDILEHRKLRSVIETGARFLLDPWQKHQPTLMSRDIERRQARLDFLQRAVDVARGLGSDAVSFWSGAADDDAPSEVQMARLLSGCRRLCDYAADHQVRLAFEPEPGMFIDTMAQFTAFHERAAHAWLGLTIDVGHLHCLGETPIEDHLRRWRELLWNIHLEDMRYGAHEHLMFGEGEMDFPPVLQTLKEIGYEGGVHIELSRHSHDAVNTARRALGFLRDASAH